MRLTGIDCQIPSCIISNNDILELIKYHSNKCYQGSLDDLETIVKRFLKLTGIETRFWREDNEKPAKLIEQAAYRALRMAGIERDEIDLLIYSGVDRGFIEPANASHMCKVLGLKNPRCFDISDACMGWGTAIQIAEALMLSNNSLKKSMVINAEFPLDKNGAVLPENFRISNNDELKYKLASYTLGEAVSVSVFEKEDNSSLKFEMAEYPEYAHLCVIPLINHNKYCDEPQTALNKELTFYADMAGMREYGFELSIQVLKKLLSRLDYTPKYILPHSVSDKLIVEALPEISPDIEIISTFSTLGNIATASVPSSIVNGMLNKKLNKGDRFVAWIASAGMKFAAFEIQL